MSLFHSETPSFSMGGRGGPQKGGQIRLKRTYLFVDSDARDPERSKNNFTFSFTLPKQVRNLCSLELVQYQVPMLTTPTFRGKRDFFRAVSSAPTVGGLDPDASVLNTEVDVLFTEAAGGAGETLPFSFSFDPALFSDNMARPMSGALVTQEIVHHSFKNTIQESWAAAATAAGSAINPTDYTLVFSPEAYDRLSVALQRDSDSAYGEVRFLFASGTNVGNDAANVLGFVSGADTTPDPVTGAAVADAHINPHPFGYLDITVREVPELKPLARVYTHDATLTGSFLPTEFPSAPRLLNRPVRTLDRVSVEVRLPTGDVPSLAADVPIQLTFEALTIESPEQAGRGAGLGAGTVETQLGL
jgi:hypothetical protein